VLHTIVVIFLSGVILQSDKKQAHAGHEPATLQPKIPLLKQIPNGTEPKHPNQNNNYIS